MPAIGQTPDCCCTPQFKMFSTRCISVWMLEKNSGDGMNKKAVRSLRFRDRTALTTILWHLTAGSELTQRQFPFSEMNLILTSLTSSSVKSSPSSFIASSMLSVSDSLK